MTAADRLRALAAAATPGPWFACSWDAIVVEGEHHPNRDIARLTRAQDAAYIAALDPGVALAIADLIEASGRVELIVNDADYGGPFGEVGDLSDALAHLEELLP